MIVRMAIGTVRRIEALILFSPQLITLTHPKLGNSATTEKMVLETKLRAAD
jgi:hypothetical protein